ncbi:MAG: hemolysin family protein [Spirochaetota bacterium]
MIEIIGIAVLIAANGAFALAEFAFVSARREVLETFASQGDKRAPRVLAMMNEPDKFLSSIQVGITLIGIIAGTVSGLTLAGSITPVFAELPIVGAWSAQLSLVLVVSLVTYFSILFGELVPKTIAIRNPEKTIMRLLPLLAVFSVITYPATAFLSVSTRFVLRIIGISMSGIDESEDPINEILGIAKMAAVKNKLSREQASIIANAMRLKDLTVQSIMVRREDMKVLSTVMTLQRALIEAHVHHHTRYPLIHENDPQTIIGYVNFKDIVNALRINPSSPSLKSICRPAVSVGPAERLSDVLKRLIKAHQHIALVRSPDGAPLGMISLENILESIVGDIQDEYDMLPEFFYTITPTRWLAGGGVQLAALKKVFRELPDEQKTLASWIAEIAKGTPKVEQCLMYNGLTFFVRKMSRSQVNEAIIERAGPAREIRPKMPSYAAARTGSKK